MKDDGASAVLGTLLMMGLMMSMVPAVMMATNEGRALAEAQADVARAERERAELASFCARNPTVGPPTCAERGPLPGYECESLPGGDVWTCRATNKTPTAIGIGMATGVGS